MKILILLYYLAKVLYFLKWFHHLVHHVDLLNLLSLCLIENSNFHFCWIGMKKWSVKILRFSCRLHLYSAFHYTISTWSSFWRKLNGKYTFYYFNPVKQFVFNCSQWVTFSYFDFFEFFSINQSKRFLLRWLTFWRKLVEKYSFKILIFQMNKAIYFQLFRVSHFVVFRYNYNYSIIFSKLK